MVNPKKKGFILVLTLSLFLFPLVSTATFPIYVTPLDGSGNLQPTTSFAYEWKFTSASDCSGVLFTKTATIITDKYGRGFVNLTLEPFSTIPSYVCEYRNGTLRASLPLSLSLFSNTYVQNINASGNVTAQYFFGDGSQLTGIAMAGETDPYWGANLSAYNASWSSTYNATYAAYNSTGLIKDWNATGLIRNWSGSSLSSETDPHWSGNYSNYLTLFNWNKTYADTLYYGINNPYGYINSTTLSGSESDPLWAANQSLYPRITELVGLIGNWSLDKSNYYNKSQIENNLSNYYPLNNPYSYLNATSLAESDPLWTANQSSYSTTSQANALYYGINNPSGFYNSSNFNINDYYLKSNPYGYINSTSLSASETDPHWASNQSLYARINELVGLVGNFSAYIQPTALSNFTDNILWTAAFNSTGDSRWLSSFSETDPLWSGNASSVYLKSNPYGFYNSTSLTSLSQLADNLGNRGYTSLSNFTDNLGNRGYTALSNFSNDMGFVNSSALSGLETDPLWSGNYSAYNATWSSTYNSSYATWAYNQTTPAVNAILGFNYYNLTNFDINNYYLKSNPYEYINSTTLSASETDPHWASNQSSYPRITELVGLIGNWSADKSSYYTSVQTDSAISNANTSIKNYVDGNYYPLNNPYSYLNATSLAESDPLWTANQSSYSTTLQANALYYGINNPSGFYNSSNFNINDYYLKSNPYSYINSTSLAAAESDPHWTSNQSNYYNRSQIEGNFTNYYNSTQTNSAIVSANTSLKNYADAKFIASANEANLNVNSSGYWDSLDSPSDILGSSINNDLNWINATTLSAAENDPMWTSNFTAHNVSWSSTYNSSYATWAYNQTTPAVNAILGFNYYNLTNFDINNYYLKSNPYGYLNSTTLSSSETDPHWASNQSSYPRITELVGLVGNFSAYIQPTALSNFTDNLGNRGYTALSNFSNDMGFVNSSALSGLETDPLWAANQSSYYNKSQIESNLTNYYPLNNPYSYINSTSLSSSESDPHWSGNLSAHNVSWSSTYNSSYATWAYNQTTAATNILNGTGLIKDWNSTGYIRNWNAEIGAANTSIKNYADGSFLRRDGDNGTGTYNFGGSWTEGGATIRDGNLYAQTVYVYNVTSLGVNNLNINGSLLPPEGYDATFDIGAGTLRWRDGFFSRNLFVNGTVYSNSLPVLTSETDPHWTANQSSYYTKSQVDSNFTNYYTSGQTDSAISNANTSIKNYVDGNYYPLNNPYSYLNATSLAESDPLWTANQSSYSTTLQANALYYGIGNPYGYLNSTTLSASETDPQWTSNQSSYPRIIELVGLVGNWTADRTSYYNTTQVDSSISSANTSLKNYADNIFYLKSNPYNFVNSTTASGVYVPYTGSNANVVLGDYNLSVGTSDLFVDASSGKVGIGTTEPTELLHLYKDQNAKTSMTVVNPSAGTGAYAQFTVANGITSTDVGGFQAIGSGFTPSGITLADSVNIFASTGISNGLGIFSQATGAPLRFGTESTERIRLTSAGNIGMNTTAPTHTLNVKGEINVTSSNDDISMYMENGILVVSG